MMRYEYATVCRMYNIGRTKRYGEEESDEEEDEEGEEPNSSAGNDDENVDLMDFLEIIGSKKFSSIRFE